MISEKSSLGRFYLGLLTTTTSTTNVSLKSFHWHYSHLTVTKTLVKRYCFYITDEKTEEVRKN